MSIINKTKIQASLHQEDPYLMVDTVKEISQTMIFTTKTFGENHPITKAHFPGKQVVPGALLQEICTQSAGLLITLNHSPVVNYDKNTSKGWALGVLRRISLAKFSGFVDPNQEILCKVELKQKIEGLFDFSATIKQAGHKKARIDFSLVNIPDSQLGS